MKTVKIKGAYIDQIEFEQLRGCYIDKTNTGCGMTTAASKTSRNIIFEPYVSTVYGKFTSFDEITRIGIFGGKKTLLIAQGTFLKHVNAGGYENIVCTYDAIKKLTLKGCTLNLKEWNCVVDEVHDFDQVAFRPVIEVLYNAIKNNVFKTVMAFTATPTRIIPDCFKKLKKVKLVFKNELKHSVKIMPYEESVNNSATKLIVANVLANKNKVHMIACNNVRSISIIERTLATKGLKLHIIASATSLNKIGGNSVSINNADVIIGTCKIFEGWDYYANKPVCMHAVITSDYSGRFITAKNLIQFLGRVRNQDKICEKFVYTKTMTGNSFVYWKYKQLLSNIEVRMDYFESENKESLTKLICNNMLELKDFEEKNIIKYLNDNNIDASKEEVYNFVLTKLEKSRVFYNQLLFVKRGGVSNDPNINLYAKFNPNFNYRDTSKKMIAEWCSNFITCDWFEAYKLIKEKFSNDKLLSSKDYKEENLKYKLKGCGCDVLSKMCDVKERKLAVGRRKQVKFNESKATALLKEVGELRVKFQFK